MGLSPVAGLSKRAFTLRDYLQRVIWLCLMPLALVIAALSVDTLRRVHADRTAEVLDLARLARNLADTEIDRRVQALRALATESAFLDDTLSLPALYARARKYHDTFGSPLLLTDERRTMLLKTRVPLGTPLPPVPVPAGRSALDMAWVTGETTVGDMVLGPVIQQMVVPIVEPSMHPMRRETPSGTEVSRVAWIANIEATRFARALDRVAVPPSWQLRLVDGAGQRVAALGDSDLTTPHEMRVALRMADWTVHVAVDRWVFYRPHLQWGAALLAGLLATLGLAAWVARRSAQRIGNAVTTLANPPEADASESTPAEPPTARIAEIDTVRERLRHLDQQRKQAQHQHLLAEQQHLTELHSTLQALRQSEERMRAMFEGATEAVMLIDSKMRVVSANPASAEMLATSVLHLQGAHILDFAPQAMRTRHEKTYADLGRVALLSARATRRAVVSVQRRDGCQVAAESLLTCIRHGADLLYVLMMHDVSERVAQTRRLRDAHRQLRAANRELHRLNAVQRSIEERERSRIARELHDGLQQQLGVLQMKLELIADQSRPALAPVTALALDARDTTQQAIESIRRIVNDLRPRSLDELGLAAALRQLVDETSACSGLLIELEIVGDESALDHWPGATCDAFYRVVQECLNNVRKHARASFVHVLLDLSDPSQRLLQVSDDGCGITDERLRASGSFGLQSMTERAAALGGTLRVTRGHGGDACLGTTVCITVPAEAPGNGEDTRPHQALAQ